MTAKVCLRCDWSGAIGDDTCPRCGAGLFSARSDKAGADVDRPSTALAEQHTERSWRTSVAARAHRRVRCRRGGHRPTAHAVGGVQRGRRHGSHGIPDHLRSGGRRGPHVDLGSRRRYRGAGATAATARQRNWSTATRCMPGGSASPRASAPASPRRSCGASAPTIDRCLWREETPSLGRRAAPPSAFSDRARPGPVRGSTSVPGWCRSVHRRSDSTGSGVASPWPSRVTGTCPT